MILVLVAEFLHQCLLSSFLPPLPPFPSFPPSLPPLPVPQAWLQDMRIHLNDSQNIPVLFVGNKEDQLPDTIPVPPDVNSDEAPPTPPKEYATLKNARRIMARENLRLKPLQCSAATGKGVGKVFEKVAEELAGGKPSEWPCVIL